MVLQTLRLARAAAQTTFRVRSTITKGLAPGINPMIRTTKYLEQGIVLRDSIKIMMINYGDYEKTKHLHEGAR